MPNFGYAIYRSDGVLVTTSQAFRSVVGLRLGAEEILDLEGVFEKGCESTFFSVGTIWAVPKSADAKYRRVQLSIAALPLEKGSALKTFIAEIDAVGGAGFRSRKDTVTEESSASGSNSSSKSKRRILVVEDNDLNADIIAHFLRDYGVSFDLADNGLAAIEACRENRYDLVLMDIMLPRMNGYEATENILRNKDSDMIPVVIGVTAKVFRDDRLRCFEVGMSDVIHKPVDFTLLRKVLDRYLLGVTDGLSSRSNSIDQSHQPGSSSVLDGDTASDYARRMADTPEERRGALDRVLESFDELIAKIRVSAQAGDIESIERHAHTLKGNAALIGAWDLSDLAKGLERIAGGKWETLRAAHWLALLENASREARRLAGDLGFGESV